MLRYIYLLCLINFELVFCYNSIHSSGKVRRSAGARIRRRDYGSEDSPLTNIDVVGFMQKTEEAEDFEPYSYESKRRGSKYDYLSLDDPAPRLRRRSHHELSADELNNARSTSPGQQRRFHARHLARHPKRKCSFSLFPFFSHKNKSKSGPSPKHNKRKSHSSGFFKGKHEHDPSALPDSIHEEKKMKSHQEVHITAEPRIEGTTVQRMSPNCKMKMTRAKKSLPKMIHNSRQYFANRFRMDNDTDVGVIKIKNDSKRERVNNDNVRYEDNNERESTREEFTGEARAKENLSSQQKEQQKVLEELENRLRESYHVLRNLFK